MKKIMIMTSDVQLGDSFAELFKNDFDCVQCNDVKNAFTIITETAFDLLILDHDADKESGLGICKYFKAPGSIRPLHIIYVAKSAALDDKVAAFEAGASDFCHLPVNPREFFLRVNAKFVRSHPVKSKWDVTIGNCKLRWSSRQVFIDEKEIQMTTTELTILRSLISNSPGTTSREAIVSEMKQRERAGLRTIDTHIFKLKKKLADFDWEIQVVPRVGYRLVPGLGADQTKTTASA